MRIGLRGAEMARFVGDVSDVGETSRFTLLSDDIILFRNSGGIKLNQTRETALIHISHISVSEPVMLEIDEITRHYGPVQEFVGDLSGTADDTRDLTEIADLLANIAPAAGPAGPTNPEGGSDPTVVLTSPFRWRDTPFRNTDIADPLVGGGIDIGGGPGDEAPATDGGGETDAPAAAGADDSETASADAGATESGGGGGS